MITVKKKAKGTKKAVIKRLIRYESYVDSLYNDTVRPQQRFKSDYHDIYTEEGNKTALSSNDDKRLQTLDKVTTYPHRTNAFKMFEREMMVVRDLFVENYVDFPFYDEIILKRQ